MLLRIDPLPGYSPTIGRLVGMMTYARQTTLDAVRDLTVGQLDHLHDATSNSIGALLAHAIAVEWYYQIVTLEDREPSPDEEATRRAALDLGDLGRQELRGRSVESYSEELASIRASTLAQLARRDDAWLEKPLVAFPEMNAHWAWFHVAEDEINHRGQIRFLRARLPK